MSLTATVHSVLSKDHAAQAPELHAFAVADESSYYLFVVNEDEAAPAETEVSLDLLEDVPGGSTVIACLVAEGCDAHCCMTSMIPS